MIIHRLTPAVIVFGLAGATGFLFVAINNPSTPTWATGGMFAVFAAFGFMMGWVCRAHE